ncbi:hypothetical protein RN001_001748 [Aquatica leii]|uniref:peptidylamidoglycolate lyase n=1 Tax=Aquatica leii TaxID=1421715 RepID=A0AAN7PGB8_9COLE|nr:hypothetical protein RN001_001748 [Aquatica leii]
MATKFVAVLLSLLCFDGILSAIAYESIPANLNSDFYNDLRQLLKLSASLHSKSANEKRNDIIKDTTAAQSSYLVPQEVENWPETNLNLGQVSGVAVNTNEEPVIFHRGDRVWDINTFDYQNNYAERELGPISTHTVLTLDPKNGRVIKKWGKNLFYMPHGITIDHHDNMWITDVALHQAFKFRPGKDAPDLVFGVRFEPGIDDYHLCKPTSVSVASTGEIFIADGYCNSRILKFNALGRLMRTIPSDNTGCLSLAVPHHTALIESLDRICVADRENKRVVCPSSELRTNKQSSTQALTIQTPDMGRIFGIAAVGEIIYAVNGPSSFDMPVQGFTISVENETVIGVWGQKKFSNPHAIAASSATNSLYVVEIGPNKVWKFKLFSARINMSGNPGPSRMHPDDSGFEKWCTDLLEDEDCVISDEDEDPDFIIESEHDSDSEMSAGEEGDENLDTGPGGAQTQENFYYGRQKLQKDKTKW